MLEKAIHEDSLATLNRLRAKHPELTQALDDAYGFAVFPSVGRAGVVLGGAYGHGEVYERGKPIGFATLSQMTVGVQVGGQTFDELVLFRDKQVLERFKQGLVAFAANASAVLVKAAGSGTTDTKDLTIHAYSRGGMLLELSLGGQKFSFQPPMPADLLPQPEHPNDAPGQAGEGPRPNGGIRGRFATRLSAVLQSPAVGSAGATSLRGARSLARHVAALPITGRLRQQAARAAASKPAQSVRSAISSLKTEQDLSQTLHPEVQATLKRIEDQDPEFRKRLDEAYGYAVFPSVGRASAVLGGTFGRGEVFEEHRLIGYAGIVQLTIGLQLGGQTFAEIVTFEDREALDGFKKGGVGFAANAAAVIVKAGAAASKKYKPGTAIYVFSDGGLTLEAAIGGQKFIFRPGALTRGKPAELPSSAEAGQQRGPGREAPQQELEPAAASEGESASGPASPGASEESQPSA